MPAPYSSRSPSGVGCHWCLGPLATQVGAIKAPYSSRSPTKRMRPVRLQTLADDFGFPGPAVPPVHRQNMELGHLCTAGGPSQLMSMNGVNFCSMGFNDFTGHGPLKIHMSAARHMYIYIYIYNFREKNVAEFES